MLKTTVYVFTWLIMVPAASLAQAAPPARPSVTYPGSFWTTNGTLSPAERGNLMSLSHAEQGMLFKRYAEVFVSTTLGVDSKGFDWNNKSANGIGVRLTQNITTGMVRVSAQWMVERRWVSHTQMSGAVLTADSYFQWGRR